MKERKKKRREEVLDELRIAVVARELASEHVEVADARHAAESTSHASMRRIHEGR